MVALKTETSPSQLDFGFQGSQQTSPYNAQFPITPTQYSDMYSNNLGLSPELGYDFHPYYPAVTNMEGQFQTDTYHPIQAYNNVENLGLGIDINHNVDPMLCYSNESFMNYPMVPLLHEANHLSPELLSSGFTYSPQFYDYSGVTSDDLNDPTQVQSYNNELVNYQDMSNNPNFLLQQFQLYNYNQEYSYTSNLPVASTTSKNNNASNFNVSKEKPPYSYSQLITLAILESPNQRMLLSEIYDWLANRFTYFKDDTTGVWKNSVRHNLSVNKAFIRFPRHHEHPGKGSYWCLDPNFVTNNDLKSLLPNHFNYTM